MNCAGDWILTHMSPLVTYIHVVTVKIYFKLLLFEKTLFETVLSGYTTSSSNLYLLRYPTQPTLGETRLIEIIWIFCCDVMLYKFFWVSFIVTGSQSCTWLFTMEPVVDSDYITNERMNRIKPKILIWTGLI